MKKSVFIFLFVCPILLLAQKGTIVPDVKPQTTATIQNDIKTWMIEDYLLNCSDSITKCYLIKENGVNKTVPVNDVYNFVFEEGTKYTVQVKEELKTPPVSSSVGIYNYTITKIISKKNAASDASAIPTVSTKSSNNIPVVTAKEITPPTDKNFATNTDFDYRDKLEEDIKSLKKQVADLKKQLQVIQLQMDMQLQLFQKK